MIDDSDFIFAQSLREKKCFCWCHTNTLGTILRRFPRMWFPDQFHQSHNSPTIWISENLAEAEMKMWRRVTLPLPRVSRMQPSSTQNLILSDLHTVCYTVCTERYTQRMELSELQVHWNWAMYMRWVCWRFLVHIAQGVYSLCALKRNTVLQDNITN